jgi:hypothetical protein
MGLSPDVQLVLLGFIPFIKFNLVCKRWYVFLKTNVHHIHTKKISATNKIGEWYFSYKFKFKLCIFNWNRGTLINTFPKYTRRLPRHPGTERITNKIRFLNYSLSENDFLLLPYKFHESISNIERHSDAEYYIIKQNSSIDDLLLILSDSLVPNIRSRYNTYIWLLSLKLPYFIWPFLSSGIFYKKDGTILPIKPFLSKNSTTFTKLPIDWEKLLEFVTL